MTIAKTQYLTLLDRLSEGPLPQPEALRYAILVAQELGRIHASGAVHGALCPAVILFTESGTEVHPHGAKGEVTPYTAPEVLAGMPANTASDIFAFGAILYEMLSGRRAFEGDTPEALRAAIVELRPAACAGTALDRLVQTCLAKDPRLRYQRVEKVLMELRLAAIAAGRGPSAPAVRREMADARLEGELRELRQALEQLRGELKRQEDVVAWVVEILETMQANALEPSR